MVLRQPQPGHLAMEDDHADPPPDETTPAIAVPILVSGLALLLVGVVTRIWLLHSRLGPPDADESVVLLMAKDMRHGHFETFFWGQEYGGTQEALLIAGTSLLGVPLRWGGEIVTIGLSAAAAALLWGLAKPLLGPAVAFLAGSLYWAAPILFVFLSQKERGFYGSSAVSCLAALFFAARLLRGGKVPDALGLGLAVGSAIWSSPQSFYLLVPTSVWFIGHILWRKKWPLLRSAPCAALAAVVGGLPWLWTNAHTRLASLEAPPVVASTPGERLSGYWRLALPQVTGFKLPYDSEGWIGSGWLIWPHLGLICLVLAGAVMLARKAPWVPLALAWHPLMFVALSTSFYVTEARYLFLLWPPAALALAFVAVRFGRTVGAAALAALCGALSVIGCDLLIDYGNSTGAVDLVPWSSQVLAVMDRLDVEYAFADYWASYNLEVASEGDVVVSPLYTVRDPRREEEVRAARRVAYILRGDDCVEWTLKASFAAAGQAPPVRLVAGPFVVLLPQRPVMPEDVLPLWADERGAVRPDPPPCP